MLFIKFGFVVKDFFLIQFHLQSGMLITAHDMRLVQELFPRTTVMDDGNIVADGLTWIFWRMKNC